MDDKKVISIVKKWVETIVVDLQLCPFAKREMVRESVHFEVSNADSEELLLLDLMDSIEHLALNDSVETTLLIHPNVLKNFNDYNQFLPYVEHLLEQMNFHGVFQVASFHPDYQFAETEVDDVTNYTNRSPFPILHILRESSLDQAIETYPDVDSIPANNIKLMKQMGVTKIENLLKACFG